MSFPLNKHLSNHLLHTRLVLYQTSLSTSAADNNEIHVDSLLFVNTVVPVFSSDRLSLSLPRCPVCAGSAAV